MIFDNFFTVFFLSFLFLSIICKIILDIINYRHRKRNLNTVPEELAGLVDAQKLLKINEYSNIKLSFSLVEYFFNKAVLIFILMSGLIPFYYNFLTAVISSKYFLILLFFGAFFAFDMLTDIPFSLYFNFVIEKRFNFNKMTLGLWTADLIKKIIITAVIGSALLSALTFFIYAFPQIWWFLLWIFFIAFSLIMQIVYPAVIAPLFNKFKPLQNEPLRIKIEELLKDSGLKSSGVFEMDASKRSSHSNAYFTGIGRSKRIVLFDSLLQKHTDEEILAILAHEIGHYAKKHILKGLIFSSVISLAGLFIAYFLINYQDLYAAFGFAEFNIDSGKFMGLFLLSVIIGPVSFFFTPVGAAISRKNEREADRYSFEKMKTPEYLISALKKLNVDNLSNIYPADIYSWFYYSHPPLFKRIKYNKSLTESNPK